MLNLKPKKPNFKIGDLVFCRALDKRGVIEGVTNFADHADIRKRGYVYFVRIGERIHTISEASLLLSKGDNEPPPRLEFAPFLYRNEFKISSREVVSKEPDPLSALIAKEEPVLNQINSKEELD